MNSYTFYVNTLFKLRETVIKYLFKIILSLLYLSNFFPLQAQTYSIKNYTVENGLSSSWVNSVTQDTIGRMWFATRNGITRYDGSKWKYFNFNNLLGTNDFKEILADKFGNIWAVTSIEKPIIVKYNGKSWSLIKINIFKRHKTRIIGFQLLYSKNKIIPVVATNNLGIFYYKNDTWHKKFNNFNYLGSYILTIKQYNNKLYVATQKGFYIVNNLDYFNPLNKNALLSKRQIFNFGFQKKNKNSFALWILGKNYIGLYKNNKLTIKNNSFLLKPNPGYAPFVITANYYGRLIFGNYYKIFLYDPQKDKITKLGNRNGLLSPGAHKTFVDREKNLWVCGYLGVSKIMSMRFATYKSAQGLFSSEVTAIEERKPATLVFGHKDGLTLWYNNKMLKIPFKNSLKTDLQNTRVLDLFNDGKGNIWIATPGTGLGKLSKNNHLKWYHLPDNNVVYSVTQDIDKHLLILTNKSLYKKFGSKFKRIISLKDFNGGIFRKIFTDKKGDIYLTSSANGVIIRKKNGSWKVVKSSVSEKANDTYSVFFSKYRTFVGSSNGLYIIKSDTLKKFTHGSFQINNPVYFIQQDSLKNLWFGTNAGVIMWNSHHWFHYTTKQGLSGLETNRDAGFVDSKGSMWIGTEEGLSKYQPGFDNFNYNITPKVYIENIETNEKILPFNEVIKLNSDENNILFRFISVSFTDERQINYWVKLDGFDKNWISITKNSSPNIRYTNLPSGNYTFMVKAKNFQGNWSNVAKKQIMILTPFYRHWWAIPIIIALIALVINIFIAYLARLKYTKNLAYEVEKRTQELKESEAKYRSLIENMQDGLYMIDEGKIVFINEALAKMIGYTVDELIGMNYLKVVAPEDIEMIKDRYAKRRRGEKVTAQYEFRMLHKDQTTRIVVNMHVGVFKIGDKIFSLGTIRDITEKYLAQQKIKESEERFRSIFENNTVGIYRTTPDGKILLANRTLIKMLGYNSFEEIKNLNLNKDFPIKFDRKTFNNALKKDGFVKGLETKWLYEDGTVNYVRESAKAFEDSKGNIIYYEGVIENITDIKKAEDKFRKSERKNLALLNAIPDPLFDLSSSGKIISVRNFEQFGVSMEPSSLIGRKIQELLPPEVRKKAVHKFIKVLRTKKTTTFEFKLNIEKKNIFFEARLSLSAENRILVTVRNITERKNYENALIKARDEAEKSDRLKSEFLAQISHEIRTPINSILSFTSLLKEECATKVSDEFNEVFKYIDNGGRRLISTIDLILNMSQIQSGTYEPVFSSIEIDKEVFQSIIPEQKHQAKLNNLNLIYKVETEDIKIEGDLYTIGQIFINLLNNAIDRKSVV